MMWLLVSSYCFVTMAGAISCREQEHPQPDLVTCVQELPKAAAENAPALSGSIPITKLHFECKRGGDL